MHLNTPVLAPLSFRRCKSRVRIVPGERPCCSRHAAGCNERRTNWWGSCN
ncbi:hypothetical protein NPIL_700521, partial [Nephila pilipes]